jgi:hypothetical protein
MIIDCGHTTVPFEGTAIDITRDSQYSTDRWRLTAYIGGDKFMLKGGMSWDEAKWELRGIVDAYEKGEKIYEVK